MKNYIFRVFNFLFLLLIISVALSVSASALTRDGIEYTVVGDNLVLTGCDESVNGEIVIPDYIDGTGVVSIGEKAFEDRSSITEIKLPETITSIGDRAFSGCSNLLSFEMPESVTKLGKSVFENCRNLRTVKISSNILTVPEKTFSGCSSLKNVSLSADVTAFSSSAFKECENLNKFVFPEKTEYITDNCFYGCKNLETVYFPAGIRFIGNNAFASCESLSYIYCAGGYIADDDSIISSGNKNLINARWFTGHTHSDFVSTLITEPTCDEFGYTEFICRCGYKDKIDLVEPIGHKLEDFITVVAPDCKNNGKAYWYCKACTYYEEVPIAKTAHKSVADEAIAPDCYTDGKTAGSHCYVCGEIVVEQKAVPALGHNFTKKRYEDKYLVSPATYSTAAKYCYSCSRCNAVSAETFDGDKLILDKPSKINSTSTSSTITLTWSRVVNSDFYAVYYLNASGKWSFYKKVTGTVLNIKSLSSGRTITFGVRAYVVEKGKNIPSPYYVTVTEATRPLKPAKVAATQNEKAVKLTWSSSAGATGYRVYGYNTKTSKWVVVTSSTAKCSAIISGLKNGTYYKFAVRPYIKIGSKVNWSEDYTTIITATKPLPPSLKATSLKGGVRFEWSKVNGADGYIIYGSNKPGSGYVKLAVTKNLTFTKKGLVSGQQYYFRAYAVKKLNDGYVYSNLSAVKAVKTL